MNTNCYSKDSEDDDLPLHPLLEMRDLHKKRKKNKNRKSLQISVSFLVDF